MCAKSLQSCMNLWYPMDYSPPSSSVYGILQARILEWVSMPSSRGPFQPRGQTYVSYVCCVGKQVLYQQCHQWSPNDIMLLLLLLLSCFSRVWLCATPETAAHQAPPSLGFSRQEHWSGLPFPSPMHESESEVTQSCPTLSDPMDCSPPGSSIHGIFQARVLEWGAIVNLLKYMHLWNNLTITRNGDRMNTHKLTVEVEKIFYKIYCMKEAKTKECR